MGLPTNPFLTLQESFLHHVWQFGLFNFQHLLTDDGQQIRIEFPGEAHQDSGPDFKNARLTIGEVDWAGPVEIHINSSDWDKHAHQYDQAYNHVILHVVWKHDREIKTESGRTLPTLVLNDKVDPRRIVVWRELLDSKRRIPCERQLPEVDDFLWEQWKHRLAVERLERKTIPIKEQLAQTAFDWEEAFYRQLASNFGFKVNQESFLLLAMCLPLGIVRKQRSSPFQIEALCFGQAGFLEESFDKGSWPARLQIEYRFLAKKYKLTALSKSIWQFSRMRPNAFPTVRLAQFAALLSQNDKLFSPVRDAESLDEVKAVFRVEPSEYWRTHYHFSAPSRTRNAGLGAASIESLIINAVVPFLFVYGKERHQPTHCDRAIGLLQALKPEKNRFTRAWTELGVNAWNAFDSQALIELRNTYCSNKKCLNCHIGAQILKQSNSAAKDT